LKAGGFGQLNNVEVIYMLLTTPAVKLLGELETAKGVQPSVTKFYDNYD
jgi:hypothetical protein